MDICGIWNFMFLASDFQCWTGRDSPRCSQGDPRISIRIRPTFQCAVSCFWWFVIRWDLCDQKSYVFFWNIKKQTFGKHHFALERSSFGHVIGICSICFFFLFSFLFTYYIMNKNGSVHFNTQIAHWIYSPGTTPQMDIKPVALNTFAFAAWMKFTAFKKSEHLSTKVRGVELLFWSSDFCVSPVISAEIDSASRWS